MGLDVLRCKSPEAVLRELWTGLLVYNLIRQSMLQALLMEPRAAAKARLLENHNTQVSN